MDAISNLDKKDKYTERDLNLRKISSAQKNEHLKVLLKLKQQEDIIERTVSSHLENARIDSKILQDIQKNHLNLLKEREKIFESLKHSVNGINEGWKDVKNIINDLSNHGNLDVDEYKMKLHNLWRKIQEFHKNELIESLIEEQNSLDSELMEFNQKLHRYENCKDFAGTLLVSKNPHRISFIEMDNQDFEEVKNFNNLVAKTGHTQNWSDEDHLLFLKLRKKHKTIPALVNAIQNKCPDLSAKCIVNHEAWYKFYSKLREQQKKSVKEWRKQKEFERSVQIEKEECDVQDNENKTRIFGKSKEKITKANVEQSEKITFRNNEADEKKELIKKWREEKENKRLADEEQAKLEKQSRQFSQDRRKARAEQLKNTVAEYKKRKDGEDSSSKAVLTKNVKEDILKSNVLIKSFREQDKYYIEKRKRILNSKKENDSKEIKKEVKFESTKPRVSTLLKFTEVWKEKCKFNRSKELSQELLYIKDLPKMSTLDGENFHKTYNKY